jgi:hypothetical protein
MWCEIGMRCCETGGGGVCGNGGNSGSVGGNGGAGNNCRYSADHCCMSTVLLHKYGAADEPLHILTMVQLHRSAL